MILGADTADAGYVTAVFLDVTPKVAFDRATPLNRTQMAESRRDATALARARGVPLLLANGTRAAHGGNLFTCMSDGLPHQFG